MKCDRLALQKALDVLKHGTLTKKNPASWEVLACDIVLMAEKGKLVLEGQMANDYRTTVAIPCEGDLEATPVLYGAFAKLVRSVKKARGQKVIIEPADKRLRVKIGTRSFKVDKSNPIKDRLDRLEVPATNGGIAHAVNGEVLLGALDFVRPAICKDETRFHLCGACWTDGMIVATDGHRLHMSHMGMEFVGDEKKLSPISRAATLTTIHAGIKACSPEYVMVRYFPVKGKMEFHVDGDMMDVWVVEKCIESQFPPYEQVIPKNAKSFSIQNAADLREAAKLAIATMTDESKGAVRLVLNSNLGVKTESYEEEIEFCEPVGGFEEVTTLGVDPRYLVDALQNDSEELLVEFGSELDPLLFTYDPKTALFPNRAVVMPRRLDK